LREGGLVKCARCDTVIDRDEFTTHDAVICTVGGNYGSAVWDPFDGSTLKLYVCDNCLRMLGKAGNVEHYCRYINVYVDNWFVGTHTVNDKPQRWNPDKCYEGNREIIPAHLIDTYVKKEGYNINTRTLSLLRQAGHIS